MSIRPPTWCSPGSRASAAGRGPYAARAESASRLRVPEVDQTVAVIPHHADRGHVEHQAGGDAQVGADPCGTDGAEDVPVRKGDHPAPRLARQGDELLRAGIDLHGSLSAGRAV